MPYKSRTFEVPKVKNRTSSRLYILSGVISNLSHDELEIIRKNVSDLSLDLTDDQVRDQIQEAVLKYWNLSYDASLSYGSIRLSGRALIYVFIKDDQSIDLCNTFQLIDACGPVCEQLRVWATDDVIQSFYRS